MAFLINNSQCIHKFLTKLNYPAYTYSNILKRWRDTGEILKDNLLSCMSFDLIIVLYYLYIL